MGYSLPAPANHHLQHESKMRLLTATVAIASIATLTIRTATAYGTEEPEDISLVLKTQNRNSPLYSYPTDLTREVVPVKCPSLLYSSHWICLQDKN